VGNAGGQLENLAGEVIDSAQMATAAGDENSFTDVINERFLFELAF